MLTLHILTLHILTLHILTLHTGGRCECVRTKAAKWLKDMEGRWKERGGGGGEEEEEEGFRGGRREEEEEAGRLRRKVEVLEGELEGATRELVRGRRADGLDALACVVGGTERAHMGGALVLRGVRC
eukprot:889350-Rhodomonas_salina.1